MQKFKNFIEGVDMSDPTPTYKEFKDITGDVIPWTVMSNEPKNDFIIFLPNEEIISISSENAKWLRSQLATIR